MSKPAKKPRKRRLVQDYEPFPKQVRSLRSQLGYWKRHYNALFEFAKDCVQVALQAVREMENIAQAGDAAIARADGIIAELRKRLADKESVVESAAAKSIERQTKRLRDLRDGIATVLANVPRWRRHSMWNQLQRVLTEGGLHEEGPMGMRPTAGSQADEAPINQIEQARAAVQTMQQEMAAMEKRHKAEVAELRAQIGKGIPITIHDGKLTIGGEELPLRPVRWYHRAWRRFKYGRAYQSGHMLPRTIASGEVSLGDPDHMRRASGLVRDFVELVQASLHALAHSKTDNYCAAGIEYRTKAEGLLAFALKWIEADGGPWPAETDAANPAVVDWAASANWAAFAKDELHAVEWETLNMLAQGQVWDGDLPSKETRDKLLRMGLVQRVHGFNLLTDRGREVVGLENHVLQCDHGGGCAVGAVARGPLSDGEPELGPYHDEHGTCLQCGERVYRRAYTIGNLTVWESTTQMQHRDYLASAAAPAPGDPIDHATIGSEPRNRV